MNNKEIDFVDRQRELGATWEEIGLSFGINDEALRSAYRRAKERLTPVINLETEERKYGLVSDTHLCSHFAREDALKALYTLFQREGISTVLHAGNIVDGYLPRINGGSVTESSIDGQTAYTIDRYPLIKGIKTIFITGDDHEGWWQKEGFNFGIHLQSAAERDGRTDLIYAGHIESDLAIQPGQQILRIQHPGGGSAYARSYQLQKQVESFQGGEKPAILVQGHYHGSCFFTYRNVYCISLPGLQDQTIFGRKKHLLFEVGGAIMRISLSKINGNVVGCSIQFYNFYDRNYYKRYLKSDIRNTERITI